MDNNVWEQLNKISLEEDLDKEFDNKMKEIFGVGDQSCTPEEFFDRCHRAQEYAKKWNSKK